VNRLHPPRPALRFDRSAVIRAGLAFPSAFLAKRNYFRWLAFRFVRAVGARIGTVPVQNNALVSDHANKLLRRLEFKWRRFWEGDDLVCHAHSYTSEGGLTGADGSFAVTCIFRASERWMVTANGY